MGGRGSSSGVTTEPRGKHMSMANFLKNLRENNISGMTKTLESADLQLGKATFTINGNAVKAQEAVLQSGQDKISVRFHNGWEPTQVTRPQNYIKQSIEIVSYKNGNATAIRTLVEKKSKSTKNAEKNYNEVLNEWKKITKQKNIRF